LDEIGLAMSGGVDSTASALLLSREYHVRGFLMDIGQPGFGDQAEQVLDIAARIGIELTIVDLKERFDALVLRYFTAAYLGGRTPNPCMVCNREIKCGLFLDQVLETGVGAMATGHYARCQTKDGVAGLYRGVDPGKDQSYFLARLKAAQLARMCFPLGSMHKEDTYRLVEAHGFTRFRGKESQDICFLKNTSVGDFLARRVDDSRAEGAIVSLDGSELGRHRGLHRYTVGQRRGLGLPDHSPWYVCRLDAASNRVIVGRDGDLYSRELQARQPNWLVPEPPERGRRFQVKIRSTHRGAWATVTGTDDHFVSLAFDDPQRGICPGQFAVLYDGDRVAG
jgi:tRNA-specific 2-thiouridylase